MLTFIIGTLSDRKLKTVDRLIKSMFPDEIYKIIGLNAPSLVSETPWDEETYLGAKNRALACQEHAKHSGGFYIGLESGLVERYGHVFEEAWCCIITKKGKEYFGYSSGLKVPEFILKKMDEHKLPHYQIFAKLHDHNNKEINSDTWGNYSGYMITREKSIEESVRNALVQVFPNESSMYIK